MTTAPSPPRGPADGAPTVEERSAGPHRGEAWWQRLLVVAGLSALAVAQPVLDLLGRSPSTFQVNGIEGSQIVLFALGLVLVPPLLLWATTEAVRRVDRRAGRVAYLAVVTVLCAVIGLVAGKELTDRAVLNGLVGLAAGLAGLAAYLRLPAFATWVRVLSLANLLVLGQFVLAAPVADWIRDGEQVAIELDGGFDGPPPPVVMLVFDEWPTQSILDAEGAVDAVRFPNLAAFAEDSTWYRHFTTVSPFTRSAVPSLLDGLDPQGEPDWTDHPDNLFSLLAGSHDLVVSEVNTRLCGLDACDAVLEPEPATDRARVAAAEPAAAGGGADWAGLLDVSWEVWTERVRPGQADSVAAYDDFAEELTAALARTDEADPAGADEEALAFEQFLSAQVDAQPRRHQDFVAALRPTDDPFFAYLHLILPHQPWTIRENGTVYEVAAGRTDYEADNDDPWPVAVGRQRHLLQAEYADALLGLVLDRLVEIDEYDDALIVVLSDHGVAFEPGEPSRRLTEPNLEAIAYSPLFIKAPGQDTAEVDDTNVNITDVTPTVASMLGIDLPWSTDGAPAGSPEIAARRGNKYIHSFTDAFDHEFIEVVEFDDAVAYDEMVAGRPPLLDGADDPVAALYEGRPGSELIGRSAEGVFGPVEGTATVTELDRLVDPGAGPLLGEIAGRVPDAPAGATVVVAVDDRIVGVSPLYTRDGAEDSFVVLLPGDALDPDGNDVRVGLRGPGGTVAELAVDG